MQSGLAEERPEVRGDREVTPVEELLRLETRPPAVHPTASHVSPQDQHGRGPAVIGPPVAILGHRATELRHGQHENVVHPIPEVTRERRQRGPEVTEAHRQLTLLGPLRHVGVPTLDVGKRDLHADVGTDELGDSPNRPRG